MSRYILDVEWSQPDEAFVARCDEHPSIMAHGDTAYEALRELLFVLYHAEDVEFPQSTATTPLPSE